MDQDPGDEHTERRHPLHLRRRDQTGYEHVAHLGAVTRCGEFVPVRWAVSVAVVVDCSRCA